MSQRSRTMTSCLCSDRLETELNVSTERSRYTIMLLIGHQSLLCEGVAECYVIQNGLNARMTPSDAGYDSMD